VLLLASAVIAACASLPPYEPAPASHALVDIAATRLATIAAASLPSGEPEASGFRLLPEGETAFDARIALARRAGRSLDLQYYVIQDDPLGRRFLRELRDAATRGVRVRLLVDDLYTAGEDDLLAGLAAFPNVEVRLFNPLPSRAASLGGRLLGSLREFGRINHRMHNKLLVADNSIAISGGRNIAAEYFMRSEAANFIDLDVLSSGAVVPSLSAVFDDFWNSEEVRPVAQVTGVRLDGAARERFDARVVDAPDVVERDRDVLGQLSVAAQLDAGHLALTIATARVLADSPIKVRGEGEATVTQQTVAIFAAAHENVGIVSPYFIPGETGMQIIRSVGATQENGRIMLVTNSLASTDEPLVYDRYARYRVQLLKAGVRIYEVGAGLSRDSERLGDFGRSLSRLHAKVATIDHRRVFIGSMNLDPRSATENTEIGLVIDSPALAETINSLFRERVQLGTYRLRLTADGEHIEWVETDSGGREHVHASEPGDDPWLRFKLWLLAPWVPEGLL
jgi:putative cardiolipin synthase